MPPLQFTADPVLSFSSVSYSYGAGNAVSQASFEVPPGRVTLLLGPNGAGKTTLFSLACRLLSLQTGDIQFMGASIARIRPEALRPLGIVFQQPTLDLDLSVRQNLRYYAALHGLPRRTVDLRIEAELDRIGMAGRSRETVRSLNGGHRRRLEIARALLTEPKLLLLDEPTVGLDQPTRLSIVNYLHELARTRGIALLWATHLFDEARPDDHTVVLAKGKVAATGPLEHLLGQTNTSSLEAAFAALVSESSALAVT